MGITWSPGLVARYRPLWFTQFSGIHSLLQLSRRPKYLLFVKIRTQCEYIIVLQWVWDLQTRLNKSAWYCFMSRRVQACIDWYLRLWAQDSWVFIPPALVPELCLFILLEIRLLCPTLDVSTNTCVLDLQIPRVWLPDSCRFMPPALVPELSLLPSLQIRFLCPTLGVDTDTWTSKVQAVDGRFLESKSGNIFGYNRSRC
jgi:hypothetical protein